MPTTLRLGRERLVAACSAIALMLTMLLSTAPPAYAAGGVQGNLTGSVLDASTQAPLADVHVAAASPSGTFSASTDAGGHFTLLGLPADTYTVSFEKAGYESVSQPGVAVFGDQTNTVGVIRLEKSLRTIVHINARARNGAYQPTQTQDVTTISGQRIAQALGNVASNNEQNLILAAPGAMLDSQGNVTIRGSLNVELGYQYDGVNFTVPFFDGNGSSGFLNNIAGGSGGSLQVVSGSGDATQGNIGAGVINIVPPRGTYPATGLLSAQVGEPYYDHQFDVAYGWATPNNRISDYFSYDGSRVVPQFAPYGADASAIGQYFGISRTNHDDVQNNLVFRFGHNNDMSLQWLLRESNQSQYGNYGGLEQAAYYPYNPLAASAWAGYFPGGAAEYAQLVWLFPGVPSTNVTPTSPEQTLYQPLSFNKIGYTWNLNPSTFLNLNWANFYQKSGATNFISGSFLPGIVEIGGQRIFGEMDLTHQFGQNHTTTLALRVEDDLPRFTQEGTSTQSIQLLGIGLPNEPAISDWYLPANTSAPVGPSNPCPDIPGTTTAGTCYIYSYMQANGLWNGSLPRIPTMGLDYHHGMFHESGIGLRDQWTVNSRLHLDYGLRLDADNLDWGRNPFNTSPTALSNPSDVSPSALGNVYLRPRIWQPRFAASYQLGADDALRFSYGRSVEFFFAQTAGTPFNLSNYPSFFASMPAKDSAANPGCGSGYNNTYPQSPPPPNGGPGYLFKCPNYLDSLYWLGDQFFDAPDLGGGFGPPTYNNWDTQWSHQFSKGMFNGFGMKLTGFYRRGYNVEENTLLANLPPNPITGQTAASTFSTLGNGVEKTSGLEFMLTSPDRPTGWSGFLTMNYISEFTSNPPTNTGNFGNDSLPILYAYEFNAGQLYRSNFLPPFQGRFGLTYKTANGWKINPIFAFDGGYPTGVGAKTYGAVNGTYNWIQETNFGAAVPLGGPNGPGNAYNASYFVDPANPGSYLNPNIAASRGYNEPDLPGNALTKAHGYLDLDLEYSPQGSPWTVGAYISNVFNNHYGLWYPNQQYQPVATGVAGPQTGTLASAYPGSATYLAGVRDNFLATNATYPFQTPYNAGTVVQFYLQRRL